MFLKIIIRRLKCKSIKLDKRRNEQELQRRYLKLHQRATYAIRSGAIHTSMKGLPLEDG